MLLLFVMMAMCNCSNLLICNRCLSVATNESSDGVTYAHAQLADAHAQSAVVKHRLFLSSLYKHFFGLVSCLGQFALSLFT